MLGRGLLIEGIGGSMTQDLRIMGHAPFRWLAAIS